MVQRKGVIIGRQKYFFLHTLPIIDTMVDGDHIYMHVCAHYAYLCKKNETKMIRNISF